MFVIVLSNVTCTSIYTYMLIVKDVSNVWSTLSLCYGRCICTRLNIFPHHLSSLVSLFFLYSNSFLSFDVAVGFRKRMLLPFCCLCWLMITFYCRHSTSKPKLFHFFFKSISFGFFSNCLLQYFNLLYLTFVLIQKKNWL